MIHRSLPVFVICVALVAGGCVDDNTSFFISGNLLPDDNDCSLSESNDFLFQGIYDVGLAAAGGAGPYFLYPLYNNALQNRATHLMTDPNGILIQEAEITLSLPDGTPLDFGAFPNPYTVPTSTYVFSSTTEGDVQQTPGSIVAIPPDYAAGLLAIVDPSGVNVVVVSVVVRGESGGGSEIEPGPWTYNITLCDGCLVTRCALGDEETNTACNTGQDEATIIDCTP